MYVAHRSPFCFPRWWTGRRGCPSVMVDGPTGLVMMVEGPTRTVVMADRPMGQVVRVDGPEMVGAP